MKASGRQCVADLRGAAEELETAPLIHQALPPTNALQADALPPAALRAVIVVVGVVAIVKLLTL